MRKVVLLAGLTLLFMAGCVGVEVKAPKEPIKVDITMRLDVYQHVQQDIDSIESIVTGSDKLGPAVSQQSFLDRLVPTAHAQTIDPEVEKAALRRKARYEKIVSLEKQGILGENLSGLVVARKVTDPSAAAIADEENSDRMAIYRGIAKKNGTSVESVQKLYAERLQLDAPAGTPLEKSPGNWQIK